MDRLTGNVFSKEALRFATHIFLDDGVRSSEYSACGPVVLFESNDLRAGERRFEFEEVFETRLSPCIDRLVQISHRADIIFGGSENLRDLILHAIRVLVFVDSNLTPAALEKRA